MNDVYFYKIDKVKYPRATYHPNLQFPELCKLSYELEIDDENEIYAAVRQILIGLELDKEHIGTEEWNPFKEFVKPGQKVLLKPNQVYHEHPLGEEGVQSMITNASVIRPLIDYVLLATGGDCSITLGDAPIQGADFEQTILQSGVKQLVDFYEKQGVHINLIDMRMLISRRNAQGILGEKFSNPTRTVDMYYSVDLKEKTELYSIIEKSSRFEITDYGFGSVSKHHNRDVNEYMIPREVLEADFFINIPKLKTHRKAGMTCALKNLVGINGDKTCLAHHTRGINGKNGDEFNTADIKTIMRTRIWSFLKTSKIGIKMASGIAVFFRRFVWKGQSIKEHNMTHKPSNFSEGSWYGNDTLWRCVKDLNKILLYADSNGIMQDTIQRKYFCLVDAVLAGEGEGPMEQTPKHMGLLFGGVNPVYIDYAASRFMKYSYRDITVLKNSFENKWWNLVEKKPEEIVITGNEELDRVKKYFIPSFGWMDRLQETEG